MFLAGSPLLSLDDAPSLGPSLLVLDDDVLECVASSLPCSAACSLARTCKRTTALIAPKLLKMRDAAIAAFCERHAPMRRLADGSCRLIPTSYLSICRRTPDEITLLAWLLGREEEAAAAVKEVVFMSYPRCGYGFEREVIFEPKVPSETTDRALARLLAAVPSATSFKAGTDAPLSAAVWRALGALPALTHLEAECPREKDSEAAMYNDKIASLVEALDGGGFQKLKVLTIRGQPFQPHMLAKLAPKLPRGLTSLTLYEASLDDDGVNALAESAAERPFHDLRFLDLRQNKGLGNRTLRTLLTLDTTVVTPALEALHVGNFFGVDVDHTSWWMWFVLNLVYLFSRRGPRLNPDYDTYAAGAYNYYELGEGHPYGEGYGHGFAGRAHQWM